MYNNARELFSIHCRTEHTNRTTWRNANRFCRIYCVKGEEEMRAKVEELRHTPGIAEVKEVYNGVGEKIKI